MFHTEIRERLRRHRNTLAELGVKRLAVFGSAARGENGPDSDVDLLVEFVDAPTFDRYMELKFWLEDLLGRKVDLVTGGALRPELAPTIEREAVDVA